MANTIRYIDDDAGDHVFPVTHERAVYDSDGNTIEPKLWHAADLDAALTSDDTRDNATMLGYTKYDYYIIGGTGQWSTSAGSSGGKHLRISLDPGDDIYITANANSGAGIAIFKSNASATSGGTPDYASGWDNRIVVPAGATKHIIAPADARQLYIYAGTASNGYNGIPAYVTIRKVNAVVHDTPLMTVEMTGKYPTTSRSRSYDGFIPNHTYRVWVVSWPRAEVTPSPGSDIFYIYTTDGEGTETYLMGVSTTISELSPYYDFVMPEDAVSLRFYGRIDHGEKAVFQVEDITEVASLSDDTRGYRAVALVPATIMERHMVNAGGSVISESSIDVYKYAVTPGNVYLLSGRRSGSTSVKVYMLHWFDANGTRVKREPYYSANGTLNLVDERVVAPDNAAFAYVNVQRVRSSTYGFKDASILVKGQLTAERADYLISLMGGLGFSHEAVTPTFGDGYISATDGSITESTANARNAAIALDGASYVRFYGHTGPVVLVSGYAFYDAEDNVIASHAWDITDSLIYDKDYIVAVPYGATTFRTTIELHLSSGDFLAQDDFYCYRLFGTTVNESLSAADTASRNPLASLRIKGRGNTYTSKAFYDLLPLHTYRLYIKTWPVSEVTASSSVNIIYAESYNGSSWSKLLGVNVGNAIAPFYDVLIPEDSMRVAIGGRVNAGADGVIEIEDVTSAVAYSIHCNRFRARRASQSKHNGLTPLAVPVDNEGWETVQTIQQLNTIKKCLQMCNIKWTPKATLPGKMWVNDVVRQKDDAHEAGVEQTGIPYSGNWHEYKYVGIEVSIHTFMTAVNNPYSLLYTENIYKSKSKSAWGKTYYNTNGWMYYGSVCCAFSSNVNGQPTKYGNDVIPKVGLNFGVFVPLEPQDPHLLKIGDIGNNAHHSWVVYGLHRDANGEIDQIKIAECTGEVNTCRFLTRTMTEFISYLARNSYIMYRVADLYKNLDYAPSPYVPLTEFGETATTVTYNDDICCFAGDRATFMVGDRVAVNYNLTDSPTHEWTAIQLYRDGTLVGTYNLADIDQSELDESQKNHALDLGTALPAGKYMARMTDGTHYSDYTYWEVLPNNVTVTYYRADGQYKIAATGPKIRYVYCGQTTANGYFANHTGREPDFYELRNNAVYLYYDAMMKDWGYAPVNNNQVRVMIQGDYGMAATPPITLPGRSGTGEDEGEDSGQD